MFRCSFFLRSVPMNHLGQVFPPQIASVLQRTALERNFSSPTWVSSVVLEELGQSVSAESGIEPTIVNVNRSQVALYNADQVGLYVPQGVGFLYRNATAKEMALAAKLYGFESPFWCSAAAATNKGLRVKPDQKPILIGSRSYYNCSQLEDGHKVLAEADARVKSFPKRSFKSLSGKQYNIEMSADLSEFVVNNRLKRAGNVWGTAKGFQKHGIFVVPNALPFHVVSEDGTVYELFNSCQTSEPEVAEQIGSRAL